MGLESLVDLNVNCGHEGSVPIWKEMEGDDQEAHGLQAGCDSAGTLLAILTHFKGGEIRSDHVVGLSNQASGLSGST